ncbi:MAG: hypothetical protein KKE83_08480 [Proteobacteria bacterium]|nr:hypothetical protein [Pseudomonadota bacterium]
MSTFEEIKQYLPQYLSSGSQKTLFRDLEQFPQNIDKRFYSQGSLSDVNYFQGDGVKDVFCINLPSADIRPAPVVLLSNSCDLDQANERFAPLSAIYTPVFNLEKYKNALEKSGIDQERVNTHVANIKKQQVSHIFYLPKNEQLTYDAIIFLDKINHISASELYKKPASEKRIFSLGNLGFYVFLVKLSIHFTRIREGLDRSAPQLLAS